MMTTRIALGSACRRGQRIEGGEPIAGLSGDDRVGFGVYRALVPLASVIEPGGILILEQETEVERRGRTGWVQVDRPLQLELRIIRITCPLQCPTEGQP